MASRALSMPHNPPTNETPLPTVADPKPPSALTPPTAIPNLGPLPDLPQTSMHPRATAPAQCPKPPAALIPTVHHPSTANPSQTAKQDPTRKTRPAKSPSMNSKLTTKCSVCGKHFSHSSSLYRHQRSCHPKKEQSIHCREKECTFTCRILSQLRQHLHRKHK